MGYLNDVELQAFKRNMAAVQRFKLNVIAHDKVLEADTCHLGIDFIQLAYRALFNDFTAQAINVFDETNKVRSFWWLYNKKRSDIDDFIEALGANWGLVNVVSGKLKKIRNHTHFHFSHQYAHSYRQVWIDVDLKGDELLSAMNIIWDILSYLNEKHTGEKLEFPDYDGEDAKKCAIYVSKLIEGVS